MMLRFLLILVFTLFFAQLAAEPSNRPTITSSSFRSNASGKFPPTFAMDGKLESSWIEGTDVNGIGESITISYKSEIKFQTIAIYNGFGDPKKWASKNRVKKLKLTTDSGYEEIFTLKDTLSAQKLNLKEEATAKSIKLTILEIFKGKSENETSIAELKFLADQAGIILSPPKNTWALGKWKTESNIAKINLHNDGTCEMGYETAKMLCTWTEKGDKVLVQLEATLPLTNSDRLELRLQNKNNEPTVEVNGKYTFIRNKEEV
ncbi:discoidin domain-containing protein [Leptospira ognonensis]|uniref:Discoidin domain-containing protein n=1 Tax=Leptospira ognonensis TaxID=2484945 RepID=A0A4R9JVW7_9LEPT|nr:discoidin domain-containing protein [Leptospira ognonensis]TGL57113.1 discoidin domain-containing protein [Leptospira ognonensis]